VPHPWGWGGTCRTDVSSEVEETSQRVVTLSGRDESNCTYETCTGALTR